MEIKDIIRSYLKNLQHEYNLAIQDNQHTVELSFRTILDPFFKDLANKFLGNNKASVILEPKDQSNLGRPDWRIHNRKTLGIYGYIEAKGLSPNHFDVSPYEDQFEKYQKLNHKLAITDGIDFVFSLNDGVSKRSASIFSKDYFGNAHWENNDISEEFINLITEFFSEPSPQVCNEEELVQEVAIRTRLFSDELLKFAEIPELYATEEERPVVEYLQSLKGLIYEHNDPDLRNNKTFADFVAQVIMFSILFAYLTTCSPDDDPVVKEKKIRDYINPSNKTILLTPFQPILEFVIKNPNISFISDWVDECIGYLSFVKMTKEATEEPDFHKLFESFLTKFDPKTRFDYGAFYTPKELAEYMVKMTNSLVNLYFPSLSLYSEGNVLIDPCCGTGSFLEQLIRHDGDQHHYHLCGIEILPAPYMLANYRLSIIPKKHELTRVILANTLCNGALNESNDSDTVVGKELNEAKSITALPIKIIIGNPPSSDSFDTESGEKMSFINGLMDDFRPPVESRHARQNVQKQVQNTYLKFIRWACYQLEKSQAKFSVLSYVVPSSFLENESYRYAREYLAKFFSFVWVLAIDGDARTGIRTDSLFKTLQGRAVIIALHDKQNPIPLKEVHFKDISSEKSLDKISFLKRPIGETLGDFSTFELDQKAFSFRPAKKFDQTSYNNYWPISSEDQSKAIFKNHCSGIKLAPTSILTCTNGTTLVRRAKEISKNSLSENKSWFTGQPKPPNPTKIESFKEFINKNTNDSNFYEKIGSYKKLYSFRPYVLSNVLLWPELIRSFATVGGGGSRLRPEIIQAYKNSETMGFAMAHAPKELSSELHQFVSFCWYLPDNDMCSRGNSHIYMTDYPEKKTDGSFESANNIDSYLLKAINKMRPGKTEKQNKNALLFYCYAFLCSQKFLDTYEGAIYTVSRSDQRVRIPVVSNLSVFESIAALGLQLASLEKEEYRMLITTKTQSVIDHTPASFTLKEFTLNEEEEVVTLSDGSESIDIPCPLEVMRLEISGYMVLSDFLKFNSYSFTKTVLGSDGVLKIFEEISRLKNHIDLVKKIDDLAEPVLSGSVALINYKN